MVREEVDKVYRGKDYNYVEADWKNTWWRIGRRGGRRFGWRMERSCSEPGTNCWAIGAGFESGFRAQVFIMGDDSIGDFF
jgi:hypothetical protein